MVQPIPNNQAEIKILESHVRECFGRVVWSHKTHEKCSDIYAAQLNFWKTGEIILSAITTTSLLVTIFGNSKIPAIIAAFFSTIVLGINIYTRDYDLGKLSKTHADVAIKLWNIRESYISLIADIKLGVLTGDNIRLKRDELQELLSQVYQNAPRTNSKAYELASKALNKDGVINTGEEFTFTDEQIDRFLPQDLRRT
ncbi:SLATT domain-containing protein [Laspinema olomoucense]|uniref:SLATT domain-containing protein n=1 Tax=Laspinema olomoucense TaxID=3231600 RepID=UPI0021BA57BD|nr:SLATT domain-containing protein [Laspinema sp. D3d]MCT7971228.1 SLATT domain-containing protein [Laspinema sp. D3d]